VEPGLTHRQLFRQYPAARLAGQIGNKRDAAGLRRLGGFARGDIDPGGAGGDEGFGDHPADTAPAAGDQSNLAVEAEQVGEAIAHRVMPASATRLAPVICAASSLIRKAIRPAVSPALA